MNDQIRQWRKTCQRAATSVIVDGHTYCAVCQPNGPDWGDDDD